MDKLFAIACLAFAIVAMVGGAMVVTSTTASVNAGAVYTGVPGHSTSAGMCDPADPECGRPHYSPINQQCDPADPECG